MHLVLILVLFILSARCNIIAETFQLGPIILTPDRIYFDDYIQYIQLPGQPFALRYWGNWQLIDMNTDEPVKQEDAFLRHLIIFEEADDSNNFISGSGQDLRTWGPDLPYGYFYLFNTDNMVSARIYIYNNFSVETSVYIRYIMRYYHVEDVPRDARWVVSLALQYSYSVFARWQNSVHKAQRGFANEMGPIRIITAQGHMLQGGIKMTLSVGTTSRNICTSYAQYDSTKECNAESICFQCPSGHTPFNSKFYSGSTFCSLVETEMRVEDTFHTIIEYDSSCNYQDAVAWWFLFVEKLSST